jgi:gluconolactonase
LECGLGPDGMAFGQDGNLYAAHWGKGVVAVIDPDGKVVAELPVGGLNPTNVAFWGSSLYVTEVENGQVVRLDIGVEGQVLYGLS